MSYDVYLMTPELAGDDPGAAYLALEDDDDEDGDDDASSPESAALVADLRAVNPSFELHGLQLVDDRPASVLVDFFPRYATAQISNGADDTRVAAERLLECVAVFVRHGYVAYDPQLERVLDLDRDADEVRETLDHVRAAVFPTLAEERPRRGFLGRLFRG